MSRRFKLFIENFFIYGLGSVIGKIIPLIMLPILTRLMPNAYYLGLNEIYNTILSFGWALAIMGMYDAMFRMFFEKDEEDYKIGICSSALLFVLLTSIFLFFLLLLFRDWFAIFFFDSNEYNNLIVLTAISILIGSTNSIVAAPTRMQNKRLIFIITNVISSIVSYSVSIPLILNGMFVIALPLSSLLSALLLEVIFIILNRKWFRLSKVKWNHMKHMLFIGIPLVPNFLIYWIFNSLDRLMITKILGNEFTGVYSIGARVASISQLIYLAFAGGWQYFAFSTMKDSDQVPMTSKVFEYLGILSFAVSMFVASLSKTIIDLFFTGEYVDGYIVTPYLFISSLLLMLYQVAANQFIVVKKTWPNIFVLGFGAVINVICNFVLIEKIGIEGAAIGTVLGYLISIILCVIVLQRMKLLHISMRFCICALFSIIFSFIWRFMLIDRVLLAIVLASVITIMYLLLYKKDIKNLLMSIKERKSEH